MTKLKHYFWNLIDMKTSSNVFKNEEMSCYVAPLRDIELHCQPNLTNLLKVLPGIETKHFIQQFSALKE